MTISITLLFLGFSALVAGMLLTAGPGPSLIVAGVAMVVAGVTREG